MGSTRGDTLAAMAAGWAGRSAVAVVDLDAIVTNVETVRSIVGQNAQVLAVVKANGYGHGAIPVARAALEAGASTLGVATVDEGAQLRTAGIDAPVLVFGAIGRHEQPRAIGQRLDLVVSNADFAAALAHDVQAALVKDPVPVHLKIDTGMRRFGVAPDDVVCVAKAILAHPQLRLAGVMTHLAAADAEDPTSAEAQVAVFDACLDQLRQAGIEIPMQHVANSAGALRFPAFRRDMVRLGIAMYGLVPDVSVPLPPPMRPALTIHGRIARVFDLAPGDAVGYGRTYRPDRPERAGLVTIGYADGYRRALSSTGWMAIRGERAAVLGRVSMDQAVIRLPDGLDVTPDELVAIVGDGADWTAGAPTLDDLAGLAGTIGYELATGLAPRLPRLYVRGDEVVAVSDLAGYRELS
jgi:alanine racemase